MMTAPIVQCDGCTSVDQYSEKSEHGQSNTKAIGGGGLGAPCAMRRVVGFGLYLPCFYLIAPVGELLMSPQKFASLYVLDLFLYHGIPFLYHTHSLAMIQNYVFNFN